MLNPFQATIMWLFVRYVVPTLVENQGDFECMDEYGLEPKDSTQADKRIH